MVCDKEPRITQLETKVTHIEENSIQLGNSIDKLSDTQLELIKSITMLCSSVDTLKWVACSIFTGIIVSVCVGLIHLFLF